MASKDHENICFLLVVACVINKKPKTSNLSPMADNTITLHVLYEVWDLPCISVVGSLLETRCTHLYVPTLYRQHIGPIFTLIETCTMSKEKTKFEDCLWPISPYLGQFNYHLLVKKDCSSALCTLTRLAPRPTQVSLLSCHVFLSPEK